MEGIQNVPSLEIVYLTNFTCGDYSGLGKMGSNLKELYLVNSSDEENDKIFGTYNEEEGKGVKNGISNYDLPNLETLVISGYLIDKYWPYGRNYTRCLDEQNKLSKF